MATASSVTPPATSGMSSKQNPGLRKKPLPGVKSTVTKSAAPNNLAEIARRRLQKLG